MIPSRRTTVGLILFQDTVNATMMKLFKIWCSRCHTECIDIYSAITSFPIFLPNQPMLMLQYVCRIQCGWGLGDRGRIVRALCFPFGIQHRPLYLDSIFYALGPQMSLYRTTGSPELFFPRVGSEFIIWYLETHGQILGIPLTQVFYNAVTSFAMASLSFFPFPFPSHLLSSFCVRSAGN